MPPSYSVLHDHSLTAGASIGALQNVTTDTSNALSVVSVNGNSSAIGQAITLPSGAALTMSSDGSFVLSPAAHSAYTESFSVTISDVDTTASETVYVNVNNQTPQLVGQNLSLSHDHTLHNINMLANAYDGDGDTLTLDVMTGPSHGSLTQNGSGLWDYTPTAGWTGTDYVYAKSSDAVTESYSATFSFAVSNSAPNAQNQSLSVGHDQGLIDIDPLAGSSDADGDTLQATVVTNASHGSFTPNGDGTYSYYADAGWTGTDTVTISASDGLASSMMNATISISVTNTAPVASSAALTIEHGMVLTGIDLNSYFADAEYDPLAVIIVSGPSHGSWTQNDDGTDIYTPYNDYEGPNGVFTGTDYITFKTNDGVADSNTATLTLYVTQYAPTSDNTYTLPHDRILGNINFAANDADAMGDPTAVTIVSGPSHASIEQNTDGTWNLQPDAHYYGTDSITIAANGGSNVVVSITITDNAPVAKDTTISLAANDGSYTDIAFLADATDRDYDALTVEMITSPQHGSLNLNSTTGLKDYQADTSYLGRDGFSFRYFDGAKYSATVTVDILVYDDTTNFATDSYIEGFAGLDGADTRFNGAPSPTGLSQGNLDDCWFVAVEAGLAKENANSLWNAAGENSTPIIADMGAAGGGFETYRVTFPGYGYRQFPFLPGQTFTNPNDAADQMSFSTNPGNGDWAAILEKAWVYVKESDPNTTWAQAISRVLNHGDRPARAIEALTGSSAWYRSFRFQNIDTTVEKLTRANNGWLVTASERTSANSTNSHGLVVGSHAYTVLEYDANPANRRVHLRNPHGSNAAWVQSTYVPGPGYGGTWVRQERTPLGNGAADFWLPLTDFCNWFYGMDYEY